MIIQVLNHKDYQMHQVLERPATKQVPLVFDKLIELLHLQHMNLIDQDFVYSGKLPDIDENNIHGVDYLETKEKKIRHLVQVELS
jgi:hypothetical protein